MNKVKHLELRSCVKVEVVGVNMVLNVHRNHKAYRGRGDGGRGYGDGGRGYGDGGRGRSYTYRYTATTRMIPALRWAAMRAILMSSVGSDGQSHKTVHKLQSF